MPLTAAVPLCVLTGEMFRERMAPAAHTQCPTPSGHSALNATDRCCALCVLQVTMGIWGEKEAKFGGHVGYIRY